MFGITITYPNDPTVTRFNSDPTFTLLTLFLLVCTYLILKDPNNRHLLVYDYAVGAFFSLLINVTEIVSAAFHSNGVSNTSGVYNVSLDTIAFTGWTILIAVLFSFLKKYFGTTIVVNYIMPFWKIWIIIAISWLITSLGFLPGQISWDGLKQLCEFEHRSISALHFTYSPTNHHPWLVTLIFGHLFNLGSKFGGINAGVLAIIIIQFIIASLIYTKVVSFVWNRTGIYGGIPSLLLFASPIFSSYTVTVDKSTLYYCFASLFYMEFLTFINFELKGKQTTIFHTLIYLLSCILFSAFRNDAFVVALISIIICTVLAFLKHNNKKNILIVLTTLLLFNTGWNSYLTYKQIPKSAPSEALTLPTRQLSYVVINDKRSLNKKQLSDINKVTPIKNIKKNFDISNGDNLKNLYPSNTFLNNPTIIKDVINNRKTINTTSKEKKEITTYLKIWAAVGVTHFSSYVKVYLGANTMYLNPFINFGDGLFLNYFYETPYYMNPSWYKNYHPWFTGKIREKYKQLSLFIVSLPPFALLLNAGTSIWLSLLLLFLTIRKKNILWISLIPQLIMCALVTIVSINGYTRYTIGILATLPITISYIWYNFKTDKNDIKSNSLSVDTNS